MLKASPWLVVIALQLIVAAVSLFGMAAFWLTHLLEPWRPATALALYGSAGVVAVMTVGVIWAVIRRRRGRILDPVLAAVMAATLLAGFVPRFVDGSLERQAKAERRADDRRFERDFLDDLERRKQDVEARSRDHRPFTPEAALDFLFFIDSSDLSYRSLPDHTAEAFAILQRALEGGIVDPNGPVEGEQQQNKRFQELRGKPLFLYYYGARGLGDGVKFKYSRVMPQEWRVMELLIRYGADLMRADASPLVADLAARRSADP